MLQWGELPTSVAYIGTGQIMGWGNKVNRLDFRQYRYHEIKR